MVLRWKGGGSLTEFWVGDGGAFDIETFTLFRTKYNRTSAITDTSPQRSQPHTNTAFLTFHSRTPLLGRNQVVVPAIYKHYIFNLP